MGKLSDKQKKRFAYIPRGKSQITCLIPGPGNYSDAYKVLKNFGSNTLKIGLLNNAGNILQLHKVWK